MYVQVYFKDIINMLVIYIDKMIKLTSSLKIRLTL